MQPITIALLCAIPLASILPAQAGVGWIDQDKAKAGLQKWKLSEYFTRKPGTGGRKSMADITKPAPIWTTTSTTAQLIQVSLGKHGIAGLAAGEHHMCLTTNNLSSAYSAASGGQKVLMGKVTWNSGAPVFTPTTLANNMNTTGNVFGLMIDAKDGKVAGVDWPAGAVVSWRPNNGVPFPTPVLVGGITAKYVDPAPSYVDGKLVLFWVASPNLVYAPLNLTITSGKLTAASVATAQQVTVATIPGRINHSPTPMCDSSGNALGMWFSSRIGNDSDQYFTANIHTPTHLQQWDNGTAWVNNGGVAGGRFFAASNVSDGFYGRLLEGQGYYLVSNSDITVGPGATLTLAAGGQSGTPSLWTSRLALSLAVSAPIPVPGILGSFGLNPAPVLIIFGGMTSATRDDFGQLVLPATDNSLKGVTLNFQGLINPVDVTLQPAFTSTCRAKFK